MHEAVPAIAAEGVSPIVRIPDLQSWMIKRALDSGAHGVSGQPESSEQLLISPDPGSPGAYSG
jgi:hypothetical protein